ncbi:hypothetical protein TNCV_2528851 [Trichonephila clavipes]|nr:hypothetical protein TNCV_2528851 [Trichonephila clavipes]
MNLSAEETVAPLSCDLIGRGRSLAEKWAWKWNWVDPKIRHSASCLGRLHTQFFCPRLRPFLKVIPQAGFSLSNSIELAIWILVIYLPGSCSKDNCGPFSRVILVSFPGFFFGVCGDTRYVLGLAPTLFLA